MDAKQLWQLEKLGIDCSQNSIDIFSNLLELCIYLYEELEVKEEDRFKEQIYRLSRKATN